MQTLSFHKVISYTSVRSLDLLMRLAEAEKWKLQLSSIKEW